MITDYHQALGTGDPILEVYNSELSPIKRGFGFYAEFLLLPEWVLGRTLISAEQFNRLSHISQCQVTEEMPPI